MAGTNDFFAFADDPSANVMSQEDWAALPAVGEGFGSGIAQSAQANKAWRQASIGMYVIGQFIIGQDPTQDVLDNGDPDAIVEQLAAAVQQASARAVPGDTITDGGAFVADSAVAFYAMDRSTGLTSNQAITLPNDMTQYQTITFQDAAGNGFANQMTFTPPAGTINGQASFVLKEDYGSVAITYLGSNKYGAKVS